MIFMFPLPITVILQSIVKAIRSPIAPIALVVTAGAMVAIKTATAQEDLTSADPPPSQPALDRILDVVEQSDEELAGRVPILSELDFERLPQPNASLDVDLSHMLLIPDTATVTWLDEQFEKEVEPLNSRISFRQQLLQDLLNDPDSNDNRIRQVQSILSQLRAERDRIAIEHLLLVRQVSENGALPHQTTSTGLE